MEFIGSSDKQLRQIRSDFESYLLTRQDWRDKLKETTFDEIYKGADTLEEALADARFTNPRTLQKMRDFEFPRTIITFTPENIQESTILPNTFGDGSEKKVFASRNVHPETASFILESFENQTWNLQLDAVAERALQQLIQEKVRVNILRSMRALTSSILVKK